MLRAFQELEIGYGSRQRRKILTKPWTAHILTLFPELFPGSLSASITGRALENGVWLLKTTQIRDFASGRHKSVDGAPAGGGPGMVMRADVVGAAIDAVSEGARDAETPGQGGSGLPIIYLSPRGEPLTQALAHELASGPGAIILCGRFEGVDERVIQARGLREISIGDYVLTGGEVAAMVMLDCVVRLLPGVVGEPDSLKDESFESGLLEYPQFTKPREWEGLDIPEVLLSGDHGRVADWRRAEAEKITRARRPDLLNSKKGRKL